MEGPSSRGLFFASLCDTMKPSGRLPHKPFTPPYTAFGLLALALVFLAYYPAISAYLAFDDLANLRSLLDSADSMSGLWEAVRNNQSGPTGRPVTMATYAVQIALFGTDIWHLKLVNILIHAFTGATLFALSQVLLTRKADALIAPAKSPAFLIGGTVALIWLLHPFNLTAVAYTIQRMTSLSALFTALALLVYIRTRLGPVNVATYAKGGATVVTLGLLGIFSKENAVLLPLFALAAEATVLRDAPGPSLGRLMPRTGRIVTVAGCIAAAAVIYLIVQQRSGAFDNQPFTLTERLLTEGRAVAWYIKQLLLPNIAEMSIHHDDWTISTGLFSPASTAFSLALLMAVLVTGIVLLKRAPVIAFGLLFYFAGHALESTIIPLELVFEHRNYLPSFGLLLATGTALHGALTYLPKGQTAFLAAACIAVSVMGVLTHTRAERWSDAPESRLAHLLHQEDSMRAQIEAAEAYAMMARNAATRKRREHYLNIADERFRAAAALSADSAEPLFGLLMFRLSHDMPVDTSRLIGKIETSLRTGKVSTTSLNGVHALTRCTTSGPCGSLAPELSRLYEAALVNPAITDKYKVLVLRDKATFQSKVLGNPVRAMTTLSRAIELKPRDVTLRIEMAYYAAVAGDRSKALHHLERAEAQNILGSKTATIRKLRRAIINGNVNSAQTDRQPIN